MCADAYTSCGVCADAVRKEQLLLALLVLVLVLVLLVAAWKALRRQSDKDGESHDVQVDRWRTMRCA